MEEGSYGRQVFRATWRSSTVWVVALVGLMALAFAAGALLSPRGTWFLGGLALVFGLLAWLLLQPLLSAHPILSVGREGIGGYLLKGETIPWGDVEDLSHISVQGQDHIQIQLREGAVSQAATAGLFRRGLKRGIVLTPLRKADRQPAVQAALQGFQRNATGQALLALNGRVEQMRAHEAFEQRLRTLTPTPWALYAVIAVNVGVWLLNLFDGMSPMKPDSADLFAWGANSTSAVVRDGEYWRLLTATVLHGGVLHLALNMYALWDAGRRVCQWFGNGQFLLIYWGAGLAGSALSLHFSSQQAISVGASGAVFGVLGALLVGVYQHRERVPKAMVQQLLTSQGLFVVFMLVQGFARSGIDNAAHVGGLVAGAALAWVLVELIDETAGAAHRLRQQVLGVGLVAVMVGGLAWSAQPGLDHRQLFQSQSAMQDLLPRLRAAEDAFQADATAHREGRLSEAQLVDAMEQRHIPAYRDIVQAIKALAPDASMSRLRDIGELYTALLEVMTLEVRKYRGTADPSQVDARQAVLSKQLQEISARLKSTAP
ncbi:rhomboid family intramembrane serine protease [Hydrogenophaga sp.]|uniref:rhomboid family intramembrane serine protease n=1 Tax=Hydrogenophaga sp. TaxID=1904254 RepID=UPI00271E49C3|nr:rhomboid family intramembrane serine protease [Hydrogenophaga sp.]MDO9436258.1 rhomboid family intramembrane serine protease [Hydrogenophaga sp.]